MLINIEVFYKLILSFLVSVTRHAQSTQNKFAYLCNISIKAWGIELIFCLQININVFYKMIVSLWLYIARHAQSTQNIRFTISLQYVKENVKSGVDLLPADKRWKFLQSDTIILREMVKYSPSSQNSKFPVSLQYLKKEVRDEVGFLHEDKHWSFLEVDFNTLASKFSTSWYYHYWWVWSSIFKVLKVTSLQYLYNISKKKLGMEFIFCMQINIKTSTNWHYRFSWK